MKLGVISQNLEQFAFEDGLRYARDKGFQAVEVGACGLWGRGYCDTERLLADPGEIRRWLDTFARYDLEIRGPGEILGTRQAGIPRFVVADPLRDLGLMQAARAEAKRTLAGAG